ncbi:MAG TPA: AAA family ATPase [Candidatus Dormibacteraeota bacterium]|nr:AAA family ATPase [Candidatus Dormibacteraeota bacterium]
MAQVKVLSVTLQGFGALSGRFKLDQKLTVIGGPNESGKSTLHTAIRVALCGVDLPARGRMLKETEEVLRRYRPWRGGPFAVEAEVELEGGRYRFVRDLEHPDSAQVFDLVKGGEVTDRFRRGRTVDVSVGLGMSRDAFLAVSTVAQDQILSLTGESLQEDLQRASATSGGDSTARSAIDRLDRWRQEHIRGDRTTTKPLDKNKRPKELEEAQSRLARARDLRRQLTEDLGNQETLREELGVVEVNTKTHEAAWKTAELAEIQQDISAVGDIDQQLQKTPDLRLPKDSAALREAATGARGLAQQWLEADAALKELAPLGQELEQVSQQSAQSELAFLAGALEQPMPPLPPASELPGRLDLLDHRRIAFRRWFSDVVALVGGAAGAFLVVYGLLRGGSVGIPIAAGGLVVLVVTVTVFYGLQRRLRLLLAVGGFTSIAQLRRASRAQDPDLVKAVAGREKVQAERSQAQKRLAELGIGKVEVSRLKELAEQLPAAQDSLQQRSSLNTTAQRFRDELVARAKRVGISGQDPIQLATELATRLRQLDEAEDATRLRSGLQARRTERLGGRDLKGLAKRAEQLSRELVALEAIRETATTKVPSDELRRKYDESVRRREEIRSQLLPLQGRLQEQLKEAGDVPALEERVAELSDEVARLTRAEEAVKLAISELQRAEGLVHNDLAPILAEGLRDWLPAITSQRYHHAWVDPSDLSMHVSAEDQGAQIRVGDLSQGTREQIYVALRTVLAKALSPKGEAVPLFFDDPCVSADDGRYIALLDTLRELSANTQVVVFSHESRVGTWATRSEVPILTMTLVPASVGQESAPAEEATPAEG